MDYKKLQESMAGRFYRTEYSKGNIKVKLIGGLADTILTPEQAEFIKKFYNAPQATAEQKGNLLKLSY